MRFAKRLTSFLLAIAILFFGITPDASYAAVAWPTNIDIAAEGGILMDANSGAILYAKYIHRIILPALQKFLQHSLLSKIVISMTP